MEIAADTGGDALARLLHLFAEQGVLSQELAARYVSQAWLTAGSPHRVLGRAEWRELFDLAGYTDNGVPAVRPSQVLRLFRGAPPAYRHCWSWTEDLVVAEDYAASRPDGRMWVAEVEPGRLLARSVSTTEREYVVDTRGLAIEPLLPVGPGGAQSRAQVITGVGDHG